MEQNHPPPQKQESKMEINATTNLQQIQEVHVLFLTSSGCHDKELISNESHELHCCLGSSHHAASDV